jgi:hypothetical protein
MDSSSIWSHNIPGSDFFLIQLGLRRHRTNLAYISAPLLGSPIALKTSESIWQCPVFGFIFYVSIHLEISETVMRAAPGYNRQYDWPSCSRRNHCRFSDVVDETRPALGGQMNGVLVGRGPLNRFCRDKESGR